MEDIRKIAKRVFSDEAGEIVLAWILDKCKFMSICENEKDMALNNFAKELLVLIYKKDDGTLSEMYWEKIKKLLRKKK